MATRLQQRRGTATQWATDNPVLASGEMGIESDTGVVKVGDGSSTWSALTNVYRRFVDAVAKAGDTMTGDLAIGNGSGSRALRINGATSLAKLIDFQTGGLSRWKVQVLAVAESGANAGSDFVIRSFDDAGTQIADVLKLVRATGAATFSGALNVVGNLTENGQRVYSPNNPVDLSGRVAKTGDIMSGQLQIQLATGGNPGALAIGATSSGKQMTIRPGGVDGLDFINSAYSASVASLSDAGIFNANQVKDNGNRVYSASNPPPAAAGTLLAKTVYAPGAAVTHNATTTVASVNANLQITFTAPASGEVLIRLTGSAGLSPGTANQWGVRTVGGGTQSWGGRLPAPAANTTSGVASVVLLITGLTAGTSYTYEWISYGGNNNLLMLAGATNPANPGGGPATMEVQAA